VDLCTCDSAPLRFETTLGTHLRPAWCCRAGVGALCWLCGPLVAGVAASHLSLAGLSSLPYARAADDRCHPWSDSCSSPDGWPAALRRRWVVTQLLRRYFDPFLAVLAVGLGSTISSSSSLSSTFPAHDSLDTKFEAEPTLRPTPDGNAAATALLSKGLWRMPGGAGKHLRRCRHRSHS
jgi:hypothetical protein